MKYILDTHALLWWTLDVEQLSSKVAKLSQSFSSNGVAVSSISLWELGVKIKNGKLDIGTSIEKYHHSLLSMGCIEIIPVSVEIWLKSIGLRWDHRDPADRAIVATAQVHQLSLISKDKSIGRFFRKTVW